ncbi:hypothetical protein [Rhizosphaericola mali]|uniref:Uncharacterized protein n=1 Tax=Rhizosphaericola mali TaxID=2545455 RepID=A0A5P2FVR3_9BACT|nr:hypothetical protein [Rhizosphaericola mali]QES87596.1 hypothetical protein E0W69_002575 [Rhizosphaericola mali]
MRTIKHRLLRNCRQGMDFICANHFEDPLYWVDKLPIINNYADIGQFQRLENRCASIKAPVALFYNILPRSVFYSLSVVFFLLGLQYPSTHNTTLLITCVGLFAMPHILTLGDYHRFKMCLNTAKMYAHHHFSIEYLEGIQQNMTQKYNDFSAVINSGCTNKVDNAQKNLKEDCCHISERISSLEKKFGDSKKRRDNYGAIPQALLINLIKRRINDEPSTIIDISDAVKNLERISNVARNIGCQPENIRTELENFKTIGSLLSQPTTRLRNCLKYLERIRQLPEYINQEDFKKQTEHLFRQIRSKISHSRKTV